MKKLLKINIAIFSLSSFLLLENCSSINSYFVSSNKQNNPSEQSASTGNTNQKTKISLSDTWIGEPFSGFKKLKVIKAQKHLISTANEQASKAGEEILSRGGNAIDAAIAAQLVLNVVEPHSSGIGGGGFLLYYDSKNKHSMYFNGRETAPAKSFSTMFLDRKGKPRKFTDAVKGGLSVGTPGLLKAMKEAHEKYGKLPWKDLFDPAIKIANEGFVVDERMHVLSNDISYLKDFPETAKIYLDAKGKALNAGDIITNPKIAKTFTTLANEGIEPFYRGKIAKHMVHEVRTSKINPGHLSMGDLRLYKVKTGDLICSTYRVKYKVCSMPLPSSGGVTMLQALGILENFNLSKLKPNSATSIHLMSEALRLAYADRNEYLGDVKGVPIDKMLDKVYLRSRANLIDLEKAPAEFEAGTLINHKTSKKHATNNRVVELPSTTHLSVVDDEGNAVSLTSSIEYFFGSAISVDGFLLNNQLTDFSFEPVINGKLVANRLEPYKQPRSSMSPTFIFDENDKLLMVIGSPGGPRIIQFVLKAIVANLDWKMDIQEAISLPNFAVLNNIVELEEETQITNLESKLLAMGHQVKIVPIVSGIQGITFDKCGGGLKGGADPRRNGLAVGK